MEGAPSLSLRFLEGEGGVFVLDLKYRRNASCGRSDLAACKKRDAAHRGQVGAPAPTQSITFCAIW